MLASSYGHTEIIKLLLDREADIEATNNVSTSDNIVTQLEDIKLIFQKCDWRILWLFTYIYTSYALLLTHSLLI
jgi:hypothetical protein